MVDSCQQVLDSIPNCIKEQNWKIKDINEGGKIRTVLRTKISIRYKNTNYRLYILDINICIP